jgi:hypothetical protein
MAQAQFPIDGIPGKSWKVTSEMGWRIHPVHKEKKHHNGADIIGVGKGPFYIEAPYSGKILKATKSTAAGGGFGHYVVVLHKINGKHYTTLYAHLKDGSIKIKDAEYEVDPTDDYIIWFDGTWEDGIWRDGIWEGGTWRDGTWEDGIWKGGVWKDGFWKDGFWEGGYDKDGKFHSTNDSPNKWKTK